MHYAHSIPNSCQKSTALKAEIVPRGTASSLSHMPRGPTSGGGSPPKTPLIAEKLPLDILFEDEWILVLSKPSGLKHEPLHRFTGGSLVNRVVGHLGREPFIVHRLDMFTSGVVMFAKEREGGREISRMFQNGEVHKSYLALVVGLPPASFSVEVPIARDPHHKFARTVCNKGQKALTHFSVLGSNEQSGVSLLKATLVTGRTHQIRVHLQYAKYPILGDEIYGSLPLLWDGIYGPKLSPSNFENYIQKTKKSNNIVNKSLILDSKSDGIEIGLREVLGIGRISDSFEEEGEVACGGRETVVVYEEKDSRVSGSDVFVNEVCAGPINKHKGLCNEYSVDGNRYSVEKWGFPMQRQALHASFLSLRHPTLGTVMNFQSPLPQDFRDAMVHCGIQPRD